MEELLESWEVSQDTIKVFRDNNIDITCLEGLEEEELKILIPETRLRDRIKFKMGIRKYKNDMQTIESNTESLDTDTLSLSSCELFETDSDKGDKGGQSKLNLQQILADNMRGRQALQAIKHKKIDPSLRNNIVHAVVEYYLKKYQKITKSDFEAIASEIVQLCPTECKETYYVPSRTIGHRNTMPAKGKLVDRYYNQMRMLRKSGVFPQKRRFSLDNYTESENETTNECYETDEQWLKVNRDPWPLVEEKWEKTSAYRKQKTYDSNAVLSAMMNDWPCLKSSNGHRLIEIDFKFLYPEKNLKLFEKWDDFHKKSNIIMESDAITLKLELKTLLENDDENTRDYALCSLLPYIMKPTSKVANANKKKFNKVSIAESSEAFILQVNNYADVEEALQNRHKAYNRKGLTCQPIIVCVGTSAAFEAFYVAVDNVKYRFDSLTKALDVCFKTIMVFNLAYPKECEQLWLFIQQYFYEIQLPSDKKFSQVATFMKALQE